MIYYSFVGVVSAKAQGMIELILVLREVPALALCFHLARYEVYLFIPAIGAAYIFLAFPSAYAFFFADIDLLLIPGINIFPRCEFYVVVVKSVWPVRN